MINNEFSNGFDALLNSFSVRSNFGETSAVQNLTFDEYEKSLFLTEAQENLITSLYSGNSGTDSFESTEEVRRYLADLIQTASLEPITTSSGAILGMESNSRFFTLPSDVWYITYESVTVDDNKYSDKKVLKVYPVKQDEYHNIKDNPFRGANERRVLRLDLSEGNIEIVSKYTVLKYYLRYIKKVTPIILIDLPDDLSINGINKATECQLHSALHQKILNLAVTMAIKSRGYSMVESNK